MTRFKSLIVRFRKLLARVISKIPCSRMIEFTCRDEALFPASFERRDLGRVLRKYGQVIVLPEGLVTVFSDGVITKAAKIGLRVFEPLEEILFVERLGLIPMLGSYGEGQKIASFRGV